MELHGKNLIAGNLNASSGKTFQGFNLAKDTPLAPNFYEASKEESELALNAARAAFEVYRNATADVRAGFPVVVKAHPAHPGTSELIGGAIARAAVACGLPGGIFSLLHGGPELSIALVKHPAVSAVGFTGSHGAGRALFDAAAARPNPI